MHGTATTKTFSSNCTGVRLPVWLLLFVYYNLDTIISVSSSHSLRNRSILVPSSFSVAFRRSVSLPSDCSSLSFPRSQLRRSSCSTFVSLLVPLVQHDTEHRTKTRRQEGEGELGEIRYAFIRARKRNGRPEGNRERDTDGGNAVAAQRRG